MMIDGYEIEAVSDLSSEEIQRIVKKGRQLRGQYLAELPKGWLHRLSAKRGPAPVIRLRTP